MPPRTRSKKKTDGAVNVTNEVSDLLILIILHDLLELHQNTNPYYPYYLLKLYFGRSVLRPEAELSSVWYLKRCVYSCPAIITWFHPIWFTLSKMWRQNVNRRNAYLEHIISGVFSGVFASPRPSVAVYNTILDSSTHRECYCLGFIGLHALWQISLGIKKFNPGATPWYISSLQFYIGVS